MAAIVKSQALEMLCGSTESSVQLAGGVMRAEGLSREIISALTGCGNSGPIFPRNKPIECGRGNSDCGIQNSRNAKLATDPLSLTPDPSYGARNRPPWHPSGSPDPSSGARNRPPWHPSGSSPGELVRSCSPRMVPDDGPGPFLPRANVHHDDFHAKVCLHRCPASSTIVVGCRRVPERQG